MIYFILSPKRTFNTQKFYYNVKWSPWNSFFLFTFYSWNIVAPLMEHKETVICCMRIKQYVPLSMPVVCLPMVQCSPFQPSLHSHFPSLHVPCSVQRGWQTRWSHATPVHPSSQRHAPPTQTPWVPQSTEHTSADKEQGNNYIHGTKLMHVQ